MTAALRVPVVDRLGQELGRGGQERDGISSPRLIRITQLLAYSKRRKIPWWAIQSPPIVMKLVA